MVELSDAHAQEDSIEAGDDAEFLAAIRCEEAAVGLCFLPISLIQRLNASNRLPRQARAGQQETAAEGREAGCFCAERAARGCAAWLLACR